MATQPIPLPWVPLSSSDNGNNNNNNSQNVEPKKEEEQQTKKRGSVVGGKGTMVKEKRRRNGPRNDPTTTENGRVQQQHEDEKEDEIQLPNNESVTSSPGVPMAQSTPMVVTNQSSTRSAFSVLQQPVHAPPPLHPHQQFMAPPQPTYFYPPPMEPMHMFPANPYNPWMRWPTPGFPHQPGFFGMKMEPVEVLGGEVTTPSITELKSQGSSQSSEVMKKRAASAKTEVKKAVKSNDEQHQEDSGLGADETLNNRSGTLDALPMLPLHPINSYETYCTVPGRLTLLSNLKKYRVSIAEIQRRLAPPECLNASILGAILRKAKNKDGGRLLREQLMTFGVELTSGRRKQGALTCFTSMVEEEATQMARDFRTISQNAYPVKAASAFSLIDFQNAQDASVARMELFYTNKFLNRILDFHKADRSPHAELPKMEPGQFVELEPEFQKGLTNFSLLTHGFGGQVIQAVLETMISVINESNNALNQNFPSTSGQMAAPLPMTFKF